VHNSLLTNGHFQVAINDCCYTNWYDSSGSPVPASHISVDDLRPYSM